MNRWIYGTSSLHTWVERVPSILRHRSRKRNDINLHDNLVFFFFFFFFKNVNRCCVSAFGRGQIAVRKK